MKENRRVQNSPRRFDTESSQKRPIDPIWAKTVRLLHAPKSSVSLDGDRLSYGGDGLGILMGALQ